nr:zinc finger protein 883 [Parasteatoda tepidariorum]
MPILSDTVEGAKVLTHLPGTGRQKPLTVYICPQCDYSTYYPSLLKNHTLTHSGERPHKCSVCRKSFSLKGNLKKHMLIHFKLPNNEHLSTELKPAIYSTFTVTKRHKTVNICSECDYSTHDSSNFRKHVRIHSGFEMLSTHVLFDLGNKRKQFKVHYCSQCNYSSRYSTHLKEHMMTHTGERPFECHICGKGFSQKRQMIRHWRKAQFFQAREDPQFNVLRVQHDCPVCDYSTRNKTHFKNHMRTHSGERPYNCQICGCDMVSTNVCVQGTRQLQMKIHFCTQCNYSTSYKSHMREHMTTHTGERPFEYNQNVIMSSGFSEMKQQLDSIYSCPHCSYITKYKHNYKNHLNIHANQKPFQCSVCGKRCFQTLTARYPTLRPPPLQVCQFCSYSTPDRSNFRRHLVIHTHDRPFECPVCGKRCMLVCHIFVPSFFIIGFQSTITRSSSKSSLLRTPLQICPYCSYSTTDRSNFKRHLVTHTDERPFQCPLCDKRCKLKQNLKKHMQVPVKYVVDLQNRTLQFTCAFIVIIKQDKLLILKIIC